MCSFKIILGWHFSYNILRGVLRTFYFSTHFIFRPPQLAFLLTQLKLIFQNIETNAWQVFNQHWRNESKTTRLWSPKSVIFFFTSFHHLGREQWVSLLSLSVIKKGLSPLLDTSLALYGGHFDTQMRPLTFLNCIVSLSLLHSYIINFLLLWSNTGQNKRGRAYFYSQFPGTRHHSGKVKAARSGRLESHYPRSRNRESWT